MGTNISQLERDIGTDFPANEHYFGLVNVRAGNEIFSNVLILTFFFDNLLNLVRQYLLQQQCASSSLLL